VGVTLRGVALPTQDARDTLPGDAFAVKHAARPPDGRPAAGPGRPQPPGDA